ncbi:MAG: NADH:ubiquinone oxidoreductase [Bacteroidales bacterium]|nr:NADH:ubiquinone oxidoreductase [Bacteroidales bacterium]
MKELTIFRQHGRQFIPDLQKVELPEIFRGRPVISNDLLPEEAGRLHNLCPVKAIGINPCSLDLGKCIFCKECEFQSLGKIKFTNDYRLAVNSRDDLIIVQGMSNPFQLDRKKIREEIRVLFKHALKLRQVSAGGDNSSEMELNAAGNVNFDMGRFGIEFVASPRHADGLVITGPITQNMSAALQLCYDAIPAPKIIILAGSDVISGGIFSGSPALERGFLEKYPVDLYLPGNPVHPLTFIHGVLNLTGYWSSK